MFHNKKHLNANRYDISGIDHEAHKEVFYAIPDDWLEPDSNLEISIKFLDDFLRILEIETNILLPVSTVKVKSEDA